MVFFYSDALQMHNAEAMTQIYRLKYSRVRESTEINP